MRLRLIFILLLCTTATLVVYLLWPKPIDQSAQILEETTPLQSLQSFEIPSPIESADIYQADNSRLFIHGIVIDGDEIPLMDTEILHRTLTIPQDQECLGLVDIQFELNNTTELLVSNERGLFSLPFTPIPSVDEQKQCLIVSASKQGYATTTVALPLANEDLPNIIEIELNRNKSIHGFVLDPNDQPVTGSTVEVWRINNTSKQSDNICGIENMDAISSTNSNKTGEFNLNVEDETKFCIQAFHPNWAKSSPLLIESNGDYDEIRLQLHSRAQLSGRVVDLEGTIVTNLSLALEGMSEGSQSERRLATTGPQGEFVFYNLDHSKFQLVSTDAGYRVAKPKDITVTTGLASENLTVTVFPVTRISGRVLNNFGDALPGVEITTRSPFTDKETISTTHSDQQGYFQLLSLHRSDTANENFRMAMAFVESTIGTRSFAGEVCVEFYHPQYKSESISLSVATASLDLGEIQLGSPTLQISGHVFNHRNDPQAATLTFTNRLARESKYLEVRLPGCEDRLVSRTVNSDSNGRFFLNVDDAGQYFVEVKTEQYKTRELKMELSGSVDNLEIKLN